jgi:hypothetical protein
MAASQSWRITPSLTDIKATMAEANAVGAKVVLSIYFRQPYVLDDASGLKNANAILANYGVSDTALMDVLTGKHKPQGKLPWALAGNAAGNQDAGSRCARLPGGRHAVPVRVRPQLLIGPWPACSASRACW